MALETLEELGLSPHLLLLTSYDLNCLYANYCHSVSNNIPFKPTDPVNCIKIQNHYQIAFARLRKRANTGSDPKKILTAIEARLKRLDKTINSRVYIDLFTNPLVGFLGGFRTFLLMESFKMRFGSYPEKNPDNYNILEQRKGAELIVNLEGKLRFWKKIRAGYMGFVFFRRFDMDAHYFREVSDDEGWSYIGLVDSQIEILVEAIKLNETDKNIIIEKTFKRIVVLIPDPIEQKRVLIDALAPFKGYWLRKKIMDDEEHQRLVEYAIELVVQQRIPVDIQMIAQTNCPNQFIRKTFQLLHFKLYGKRKRKYWIEFLHAVFWQFQGAEVKSTDHAFGTYSGNYETDLKAISYIKNKYS